MAAGVSSAKGASAVRANAQVIGCWIVVVGWGVVIHLTTPKKTRQMKKNYGMPVMDRRARQTRDLLGGKTECRIHKRFTDFDRHQLPDRKLLIWQPNSSGERRRFNNLNCWRGI
ncbi:hypothetical protein [Burkholderia ubonensis]|uniref:hypothetical protein n=1 Tax=Burkholderia ubonensis TaxID=101571 RepID=UPI001E326AD0|nr:hypothetical protein [Burkholderia ubonensis]